jgi:hypothetical protein
VRRTNDDEVVDGDVGVDRPGIGVGVMVVVHRDSQ